MSTDELLQALMNLDPEFRDALITALERDPERLRAVLADLGYGPAPEEEEPGGDKGWTVISDESEEELDELTAWSPDVELTPAEQALYSVIETVDTPRTAEEVRNLINTEQEDLIKKYSSLDNRGWISSKLNQFAKEGLVGKFRDGREVRYTADVGEAVRNWALKNDVFVEELSSSHADQIVADTNMNRNAVRHAISSLSS